MMPRTESNHGEVAQYWGLEQHSGALDLFEKLVAYHFGNSKAWAAMIAFRGKQIPEDDPNQQAAAELADEIETAK
jgi:hypothetical protein